MLLRTTLLALSCALVTGCATPTAGERFGPETGDSELNAAASLSSTDTEVGSSTSTTDTLTGQFGIGYYVDEQLEVGGQVILAKLEADGFEATSTALLPYVRWNFRSNERSWFYAGAHAGYQSQESSGSGFSSDDSAVSYGIHGGFKSYLSPRTAVFVEPRFTITNFDDFDTEQFLWLLGFTYQL